MIEDVESFGVGTGHVLVQTGVRENAVTVEVCDGDAAKVHLSPYEARHLALALERGARLAETIP